MSGDMIANTTAIPRNQSSVFAEFPPQPPDTVPAMAERLDREQGRIRYARLIREIFRRADTPLTVAVALEKAGFPRKAERTMTGWKNLESMPNPVELFVLASEFDVDINEYARGEAPEPTLRERFEGHGFQLSELLALAREHERRLLAIEERVGDLNGRLEGWEIEMASIAGREPGEAPTESTAEAVAAVQRQVAELVAAVAELRAKEA